MLDTSKNMYSQEQECAIRAVVDAVSAAPTDGRQRHVMIDAVAGAGKTHTLLQMVKEVRAARPGARILMLAFNTTQTFC